MWSVNPDFVNPCRVRCNNCGIQTEWSSPALAVSAWECRDVQDVSALLPEAQCVVEAKIGKWSDMFNKKKSW